MYSTFTSAPDEPGMSSAIFLRFMPLVKFIFLEWIFRMSNLACEKQSQLSRNCDVNSTCKYILKTCSVCIHKSTGPVRGCTFFRKKKKKTGKTLTRSKVTTNKVFAVSPPHWVVETQSSCQYVLVAKELNPRCLSGLLPWQLWYSWLLQTHQADLTIPTWSFELHCHLVMKNNSLQTHWVTY